MHGAKSSTYECADIIIPHHNWMRELGTALWRTDAFCPWGDYFLRCSFTLIHKACRTVVLLQWQRAANRCLLDKGSVSPNLQYAFSLLKEHRSDRGKQRACQSRGYTSPACLSHLLECVAVSWISWAWVCRFNGNSFTSTHHTHTHKKRRRIRVFTQLSPKSKLFFTIACNTQHGIIAMN